MQDQVAPEMIEATRLTRAGRAAEATLLLQRLLRGEAPAAAPGACRGDSFRVIDAEPHTVEVSEATALAPPQPDRRERPAPATFTVLPSAPGAPGPARTGLRETLRRLATRGLPAGGVPSPGRAPAPLPDGAAFVTASFTNQAGTRSYKLYLPSKRAGQPLPLVVMLHGCTQSPDDFAAGTRMNALAEEHACLVAWPAQPGSANPSKCWNWFNPNDQQRDRGEPSLIAGITRQIMRDHPVDPRRVYVAGLSAGGAAAAIMGSAYPDLYAAVGVHSGLACGVASDLPSALMAMRQGGGPALPSAGHGRGARVVPTIVLHGDQDTTVHPRNADQVIASRAAVAPELRVTLERGQVPGGHAHSRRVYADPAGQAVLEQWTIHGAGHAWAGGSPAGTYTDPRGPDAAREMLRFFLEHPHPAAGQPA